MIKFCYLLWVYEFFDERFYEHRKAYGAAKIHFRIIPVEDTVGISCQISVIAFLEAHGIWIAVVEASSGL